MDGAIVAGVMGLGGLVIGGGFAWVAKATSTAKNADSLKESLNRVDSEHSARLRGHDADILDIRENYVSRREFDDKIAASMGAIGANYANIKEQLSQHGRWLEYAVFNKKPDQPNNIGS